MMIRIAVIHYSATGNVHRLAEAVADGARDQGARGALERLELASVLRAAHHQGARLARYAAAIRSLRREPALVDA